jgi:hypothetical protein
MAASVCLDMNCNKTSYNIPRDLYIRDLTRRTRVAVKRIHI